MNKVLALIGSKYYNFFIVIINFHLMKKILSHECKCLSLRYPNLQAAGSVAKFYLSLILLLLLCTRLFSNNHVFHAPVIVAFQDEWKLDTTINGVAFYHSISNCNGKNTVFLKFVNNNNYQVKVSWKEVFATQAGQNEEGFRGKKSLVLPVGETSETNCINARIKECVILPSEVAPTYPAEISGFRFKEITISKI